MYIVYMFTISEAGAAQSSILFCWIEQEPENYAIFGSDSGYLRLKI